MRTSWSRRLRKSSPAPAAELPAPPFLSAFPTLTQTPSIKTKLLPFFPPSKPTLSEKLVDTNKISQLNLAGLQAHAFPSHAFPWTVLFLHLPSTRMAPKVVGFDHTSDHQTMILPALIQPFFASGDCKNGWEVDLAGDRSQAASASARSTGATGLVRSRATYLQCTREMLNAEHGRIGNCSVTQ